MLKEIKIKIPNDRGKLEEYEVCERWNDLPTHSYFYDEKCEGCRHIIKMGHGSKKFCGRSYPGTWGSPNIRGQMGCLYCKHYTKKITCQTCQDCMYEHADNPPFKLIVTKEEYEKAIENIREAFYATTCPEWALEKFATNLDFISISIKEHFEEKSETNFEHYFNDLLKVGNRFTFMNEKIESCNSVMCSKCAFNGNCGEKRFKWLASSYVKPSYKLNRFEFDLIQTYRDCYDECKLSDRRILRELKDKGHFKYVDESAKIHDILANCKVID